MLNIDVKVEVQQDINAAINLSIPNQIVNPMTKISSNKNHEFISADGAWKINLTRTFMSITTSNYSTWEDFIEKFIGPLNALSNIYHPAFFTRVGLRYVDVFCRSRLGLEECEWSDLIQPYFLGLLGSSVSKNVMENNGVCEVECDDKASRIRISTNLVNRLDNNEQCFLIDSDVYTNNRVSLGDIQNRLSYLHERSSRLVRFAIRDRLHEGMEPEEI